MSISLSLQPLLRQPFARDIYRTILEDILPSGTLQLLQTPQPVIATCEFVTGTSQTGTIQLPDGNTIALLEVHVADQIKLARNRVALRNFVARFIDEARTNAVLAVFHQPGKPDWRLTYACKRSQLDDDTLEITSTQTAPRRYTFLLGEIEPCRTAAGRLAELREKGEHLTLEEVEKAFSVERLNKDFFKDYKKHYETFTAHLLAPENAKATRTAFGIATHKDKADQDKADKPIRDFVKRLLGRLVFLHFLQKKGWMGCPKKVASASAERKRTDSPKGETTLPWTGGDPDFLNSYFKTATDQNDAHRFHSHWLIPLFFDALNNADRPGDLFPPTGTRIPYLNGGLFETDPAPLHALDFPAEHFSALLEFFGQYHFTIDENDPEDHEVGIDPEMLGHIFENLLEDNKDKGAYYTPKAIVSYMARQSLLHYLQTHLGENAELAVLLNEKDTAKHTGTDSFVRQNAKRIADLLDAVKICDPAIGSGAFPIGVLQEILWTRLTLNWELNTPEERAKLKRRIIQNSIHGVDLDPGAVEIARLRFWLALVVDEDQPRPLPNLDYKIMQGDSLIESFEGIDLSHLHTSATTGHKIVQILGNDQTEMLLDDLQGQQELANRRRTQEITTLIHDYFGERVPEKKRQRHAEIDRLVLDHLRHCIGYAREGIEIQLHRLKTEHLTKARKVTGWKPDNREQKKVDVLKAQLAAIKVSGERLEALQNKAERPYFLWHLYFQNVFAQGGFDIVIANPPYVRQEVIKDYKPLLQAAGYECYTGTADLFVYFYERAINLLRPGGAIAFITSNKFYRAGYGAKLRHFLTERLTLDTLIDFGDAPIFNDVIAYASILIGFKANAPSTHTARFYNWINGDAPSQILNILSERAAGIDQSRLQPDGWAFGNSDVRGLIAKLKKNGTALRDYVEGQFFYGIKTGLNKAFIIDRSTRDRLVLEDAASSEIIKPFIRGKDIKRWQSSFAEQYLIFTRHGTDLSKYPAIERHLTKLRTQLEPRPKQFNQSKKWPGRKAGAYRWHEIQDNVAYWPVFDGPKVIYPDIAPEPRFVFNSTGLYPDCTLFALPVKQPWIATVLNASVTAFYFGQISPRIQNGYLRFKSIYVGSIPIPPATPADKARLSQLAEACAAAAQRGDDATLAVHESEIDQIVYRLFDLTPDEITLIESGLAPTRSTTPKRKRAAS
jgi:hypothetical protein